MKVENRRIDDRIAELEKHYTELQEQQVHFKENFFAFADSVQERMTELRLLLQEIRKRINA
ncbi:hypothetical protein LLH00_09085 [bacterium]|nr:hypothetical protein [bacterium]